MLGPRSVKQIGEGMRVGMGRETGRPETIGLAQPPDDESKPFRLKITRMHDTLPCRRLPSEGQKRAT
jgi:hypothetical protein